MVTYFNRIIPFALILFSISFSHAQVNNPTSYRDKLNAYQQEHNEVYKQLDSIENANKGKSNKSERIGATPNLYNYHCQDLWLSGANIAWNQFSGDVGFSSNPDVAYFTQMFQDVKNAGGNSVRWWLHTDAAFTPQINADGSCPGLSSSMTNTQIIAQVESVLDAAEAENIGVNICLFSFDMLGDASNKGWTDINTSGNRNFLTSSSNVQTYIDNALTPMVNAFKDHKALLAWEVFNEPEGMSYEFGWTGNQGGQFINMSDVQMVVNKIAGAIHRLDPSTPVTNGAWSFRALSDNVVGQDNMNYYRDDRLIAAGGDADGTLDFYQVHYYSWAGTALSPFHHDVDHWGLSKPLMVAEYHAEETFGVASDDLYDELYHRGYFGGWGWQYNETHLWTPMTASMQTVATDHPNDIALDLTIACSGTSSGPLAACHSKFLGNIMPSSWQPGPVIRSDWGDYWNQITPENAGKWGVAEATRDNYNWTDLDEMYAYAQTNNIPFKQHVFVWGSQQPNWIAALSPQDQLQEVEEWYADFATRYPNTEIIDVVNESIRNHAPDLDFIDAIGGFNDGANNAYLAANVNQYGPYATGWDYIIWSFAKAREYFPNAELVLNDYGIINDPSAITEHLEIVNILKARGLIDAVGIQCHNFNVDNLSANAITTNLNQLATANLPIYVTELDITGATEQEQRDRYAEKFPAFWEHPAVKGVTLWGYVEGETWKTGSGILNNDGTERAAMTWLKQYMACPSGNMSPTVSLTTPTGGDAFEVGTSVILAANATDSDGSVTSVSFYDGTTLLSTDLSSPYTFDWIANGVGTHTITAVATDNNGASTTSMAIIIEVYQCAVLTTIGDTRCIPGIVDLSVSGGVGPYEWYTTSTGGNFIHEGASYSSSVSTSTTYYVSEQETTVVTSNLGEPIPTPGAVVWNIDDFNTNDKKILITVTEELTIDAVHVYPQNANTDVIVRITNIAGTQVIGSSTLSNAGTGKQRVDMGVLLSPGTYLMDAVGTSAALEYQSEDGSFPYEIPSLISITGNEPWVISGGRFGLFYDWEVSTVETSNNCARTPVVATVDPNAVPSQPSIGGELAVGCNEQKTYSVVDNIGSTYNWQTTGGAIVSGQGTATAIVDFTGIQGFTDVFVTEERAGGCVSDEDRVTVEVCIVLAIEDSQLENELYPNPTINIVRLISEEDWILMNVFGKVIEEGEGTEIDLSDYPSGMYLVKIHERLVKVIKE